MEPVLSTAVGRRKWLASHTIIAGVGTCIVLGGMGLAATLGYVDRERRSWHRAWGDGGRARPVIPAALALGAFVLAAFAFAPRWAPTLAWAALAMSLVVGQLGEMLELPQWALNLSPFTHAPSIPAEPFAALPLVILIACASALTAAAVYRFRRRSLVIPA